MRGYDLERALKRAFDERGTAGSPMVAIDPEGRTYTIVGVETEYHEDANGAATNWLKIEEN